MIIQIISRKGCALLQWKITKCIVFFAFLSLFRLTVPLCSRHRKTAAEHKTRQEFLYSRRGGGEISENYSPPTIHQPTTGPDSFQNNLASFIYCKSREWKWLDTQLKVFYGEKCLIYTAVGKIIVFRIFKSIYLQYCHKSVISLIMIQPKF